MSDQEHKTHDVTHPKWLRTPIPKHLEEAIQRYPFPFEAKREWPVRLELPFSTVDSAVEALLPKRVLLGWETQITRVQVAAASSRYSLHTHELGPVGAVRVRQVAPALTELVFEPPPKPLPRTRHNPEYDDPRNRRGQDVPPELVDAFIQQSQDEQNMHYDWRRAYFARTISILWEHVIAEQELVPQGASELPLDDIEPKHTPDVTEAQLTPRERYDNIFTQARERATGNGLSASDQLDRLTGSIEIAEWFFAFWHPRGRTLDEYAEQFTKVGKRTIENYVRGYREAYGIPDLRELDKLRQGRDADDQR